LAGRYWSDEALATYDVSVRDGHLVIALDDRRWDTMNLDPVSVDTFSRPHHAYRFIRNASGGVSTLEVSNGWDHLCTHSGGREIATLAWGFRYDIQMVAKNLRFSATWTKHQDALRHSAAGIGDVVK